MPKPQYGTEHQRRAPRIRAAAVGTLCPRCGLPILKGMKVDAGHSTDVVIDPASKADRGEHEHCNRSAGGKLGSRRKKFRPSRSW